MVFGCCCNSRPNIVREVKLTCVGIDNAGKTSILKIIKGEDPTNVLSTNGFSKVTMVYSNSFDICVYDLGGGERIRDIWDNYYAEVHGLIFVVDTDDTQRKPETYDCINKVISHKDVYGKPILFVLNKVDHGRVDEMEFTNDADLHRLCAQYRQFPYVTHVNKINQSGPKRKAETIRELADKCKEPFHLTFCAFIDKIIEHWVQLQEGVEKAEAQLRQRQEEARAARKLRLMQMEHENRLNGDIPMQEISEPNEPEGEIAVAVEREVVSPPLDDSNISSEVFEETAVIHLPKNKVAPLNGTSSRTNRTSIVSAHSKITFVNVRQKSRLQRVAEELERQKTSV